MEINKELEKFIINKFAFKTFEIDNWFNNKNIYRYKYKDKAEEIKDELSIHYLEHNKIDEWKYIDQSLIDYIFNEFLWYMTCVHHIKTGIKSKKRQLKEYILEIITGQADIVTFDKRIKPFIKSQRIKVNRIRPLPIHLRKPVENLKVGDKCYIFRYSEGTTIVDPCLIYDVDENDDLKYSVMYFTNFGDYGITTKKMDINGYNFAKVYPTEIGLTPEEAVKNKY